MAFVSKRVPAPVLVRPPVPWLRTWLTVKILAASSISKPTDLLLVILVAWLPKLVSAVPVTCKVPPLKTNALALPKLASTETLKTPAVRVVVPVNVLVPLRMVVPLPAWVTPPVPEMRLLKSMPWVRMSERLNTRLALLTMALLRLSDPLVPPLPSCRVPALTVVSPV